MSAPSDEELGWSPQTSSLSFLGVPFDTRSLFLELVQQGLAEHMTFSEIKQARAQSYRALYLLIATIWADFPRAEDAKARSTLLKPLASQIAEERRRRRQKIALRDIDPQTERELDEPAPAP